MTEKPEQPTEKMFEDAEKVFKYIGMSLINIENITKTRLELYPEPSCATCDFCLGPMMKKMDVSQVHFCVSYAHKEDSLGHIDARWSNPRNYGTTCEFYKRKQDPCEDAEKGGEEPG